jgi:pimeloyl-ACP methyl ester carboxylesterase
MYELNYSRNGNGQTVVLLHGVAGSKSIWDVVKPKLDKRYEVVAFDLLGYGYSPKPKSAEYTIEEHLTCIRNTLLAHDIKPPYYLVGLSMGSILALEYAKRWPDEVTKLVGIGLPFYHDEQDARHWVRNNLWIRFVIEKPILSQIVVRGSFFLSRHSKFLSKLTTPKIYNAKVAHETSMVSFRAFKKTLLHCLIMSKALPLINATPKLPKSFIQGTSDKWTDYKRIAALVKDKPNYELQLLDSVGHNTVVIEPEATAYSIIKFLG